MALELTDAEGIGSVLDSAKRCDPDGTPTSARVHQALQLKMNLGEQGSRASQTRATSACQL
jgi:hypothetical protein